MFFRNFGGGARILCAVHLRHIVVSPQQTRGSSHSRTSRKSGEEKMFGCHFLTIGQQPSSSKLTGTATVISKSLPITGTLSHTDHCHRSLR